MLDPRLNFFPDHIETIHLMGICGTGMAALAGMLQQKGFIITGSDANVYPPMSDFLKSIGITPMEGYGAKNLDHNPDLVIVGNVITRKHEEAIALSGRTTPYASLPQALAHFFIKGRTSIVISGTHGKTTTSSLLASSMFHADLDPSFMIGGIVSEFNSNNRIGKGSYFISEGDEYDTAFFDKGSKFLHYLPDIAVITSVEFDHADIFESLEQIKRSFISFVKTLPADGCIIAHLDDENVAEVVKHAPCPILGYGFNENNHYRIEDCRTIPGQSVLRYSYKGAMFDLKVPLSGRHNCLNALAAAVVLRTAGLTHEKIQASIMRFSGVKRRQEVRGCEMGVTVIDDFAHHPTAVKETLWGLRQAYPDSRLIAVFEPRTNSSRRAVFQDRYGAAFDSADAVIIREPVPLINVAKEDHFSSRKLADDLQQAGKQAWAFEDTDRIIAHLSSIMESGDVIAVLSNGGFDNIHERLLTLLRSR